MGVSNGCSNIGLAARLDTDKLSTLLQKQKLKTVQALTPETEKWMNDQQSAIIQIFYPFK